MKGRTFIRKLKIQNPADFRSHGVLDLIILKKDNQDYLRTLFSYLYNCIF